jgi:hypothetical protein
MNVTNIQFNEEECKVMELGLQYNMETTSREWFQNLIIDTETAIGQLEEKAQDAFQHLAHNKLRKILQEKTTVNNVHKRQTYVLKQIRKKLHLQKAMIAPADKGKTLVIIYNNDYNNKISSFLNNSTFNTLHKDPTEKYHKVMFNPTQPHTTVA